MSTKSLLRLRFPVAVAMLAATAFCAYWAVSAQMATRFVDFFPTDHGNVKLYRDFKAFGGAQTLTWMIEVKRGDIFNHTTLKKVQELTRAVDKLPGVNHQQIFSLASHRVGYVEAVPGGIQAQPFMYPKLPQTEEDIERLRTRVLVHRDKLQHLVSPDYRSSTIIASFNEDRLDYGALFREIQALVAKFEDENHHISIAGEPVVRGYGYYYLPVIGAILLVSVGAMLMVLYLCLGRRTLWWVPILPAALSVIWGLGFVGLLGLNFDPVMLVLLFLLLARNLSHSIQWMGRYCDELDRLGEQRAACIETNDRMLGPGLLAIVTDIAGILFVSFGGIPVLRDIGFTGTAWITASLLMVFIVQPILVSYLPAPRQKARSARRWGYQRWIEAAGEWLTRIPVTAGPLRRTLLWGGVVITIVGLAASVHTKVGYTKPGTPLYGQNSPVNRDIRAIAKHFPIDEGWVVLTTPAFPDPQSALSPAALRMVDDLRTYLLEDKSIVQVVSFASTVIKPFNQMFHYGHPNYYTLPESVEAAGNLWYLFQIGTGPGEMEMYFSSAHANDTVVRILLQDHTAETLDRVQKRLATFFKDMSSRADLKDVHVHYLGGLAGLYAAANEVLLRLDFINITFVLGIVFVFSAISFQSLVAGGLFVFSTILANFASFVYLRWQDLGLTIDTIPVISLGIGIGVDYGIYVVERIRDEVALGYAVDEAVTRALKSTGAAVLSTFFVMVGGIGAWAFSPVLFHSQMSVMLLFLMAMNMLAGVLILPAYIAWYKPRFVRCVKVREGGDMAAAEGVRQVSIAGADRG